MLEEDDSVNKQGESCCHATDPVCGMSVEVATAQHTATHDGTTYYFCAAGCRKKFLEDPAGYLDGQVQGRKQADGPKDALYICPMHPEVEQMGPGTCPKCGMALEPKSGVAEAEDDHELRDMGRRFWGCVAFTLPLFVVAMGEMVPVVRDWVGVLGGWNPWLQAMLATPVMLWGAWPFFVRAWHSVLNLSPNMFTLIALGSGVAYLYSLVAVLVPTAIPDAFKDHHGNVGLYFEAAAVIVTLVLLGQVLELRARQKTSGAIRALLELAPKTALRREEDGSEQEIPIDDVAVGDRLRIKPGAKIPVDGTVVEGDGTVDESMLTGEPDPVQKGPGDALTGGSVNQRGTLLMAAETVGGDTVLAQIVELVAAAQRSRAPVQQLVDRVSLYFVPTVVLVALLTFVVWSLVGPEPAMAYGLVNAVAVLIIACPCALGLATPMSIMVAAGRGAREGVLFKDAEALEKLHEITTIAVDKTGTLTEGKPGLVTFETRGSLGEEEVLALVAGVEQRSEHPLAFAIVEAARDRDIAPSEATAFDSVNGKGVKGTVQDREVIVGSRSYLEEEHVDAGEWDSKASALRDEGQTVVFAAVDGELCALLGIADPIKASAQTAVDELREAGLRVIMVTGDNRATAEAIAAKLHIEEVHAEILPEDKHRLVESLQAEGEVVAMAGDGINDAPALAKAHVGIAMGHGADIAMESAGITLVKGDLRGVLRAYKLSRDTMANIRQNLVLAFGYNTLAIPVAAGVLYPFFGLLLSPMIGAAAMSLSSVSVIGNALRLRR